MKIAVLAGGYSYEHDVSMMSGTLVSNALMSLGHEVALCDVYRPVSSQPHAKFTKNTVFEYSIPEKPTDLQEMKKESLDGNLIGNGVLDLCRSADITFVALHGGMGEDGRIQAVLESFGIRFTGSSFGACCLSMDKHVSKAICEREGIPMMPSTLYKKGDPLPSVKYPAVIKPRSCGSSIGVSFVYSESELIAAVDNAFLYEEYVLIEEKAEGREFSVSVLGGKALPSVEIVPHGDMYDFKRKYQPGETDEICPSSLSPEEEKEIGRLALLAHNALGLSDYSRSDFIYDTKTNNFIYLETNALPGLTRQSLLPLSAGAVGISYEALCIKICELALERK